MDTRRGSIALGDRPDVTITKGHALPAKPDGELFDLQAALRSGDSVLVRGELMARPGKGYRTTSMHRQAEGEVELALLRGPLPGIPFLVVLLVGGIVLGLQQPLPPAPRVLEDAGLALRQDAHCYLRDGRVTCASDAGEVTWGNGLVGVVAGLGGFCSLSESTLHCFSCETDDRMACRDRFNRGLHGSPVHAAGTDHLLCVSYDDETMECWDGIGDERRVDVSGIELIGVTHLAAGPHELCALNPDGVWCWNHWADPWLATHVGGFTDLSVAHDHVCMRGVSTWCVPFATDDTWLMERLPRDLMASRGGEVCGIGAGPHVLECSRSGPVPLPPTTRRHPIELELLHDRACVRDPMGDVRCVTIHETGPLVPMGI